MMKFIKSSYHGHWLPFIYIKEYKDAISEKYAANLILVLSLPPWVAM